MNPRERDELKLEPGHYESLITEKLRDLITMIDESQFEVLLEAVEAGDTHITMSVKLFEILKKAFRSRTGHELELYNKIIDLLYSEVPSVDEGLKINPPLQQLMTIAQKDRAGDSIFPLRPTTALSSNALLTNARDEPSIGSELRKELDSADQVDLICAFIRWYGLRLLIGPLQNFINRGGSLRVLTTTYMAATEVRALEKLEEIGAKIKIAYESQTTRLHAKAWLFYRNSGFSSAYVGSSNLSKSALVDGLEWNVRISYVESPQLIEKFQATFESYWESSVFEEYDSKKDHDRIREVLTSERSHSEIHFHHLDIQPFLHQREILARLWVERKRHNRWRNLVVAATGTGKTVVAALDYRRLVNELGPLRLLFVAHRQEILEQSVMTFRHVMRDGSFGELYVAGRRPAEWQHVFASIQSLQRAEVGANDFDVVIVDEFHHSAAETYIRLLNSLKPRVLLGLTATPERADGQSILHWFDNRIAVDLRLWEALDRQLLCPFHYFGVADGTDLKSLKWRRGGYALEELSNIYTGDDIRVAKIINSLTDKVPDLSQMRTFGFCVSVEHADYMARKFNEAGIPSLSVTGGTAKQERDDALRKLLKREVNVIFSVDIYNEGVDVPEVDTLLLLRPTESATLFIQQLGRGLRWADDKSCCTVIDFIGQQHNKFRFDLKYRALSGASRKEVDKAVKEGFPSLPSGCHFELDRVSQESVLQNLRSALPRTQRLLAQELSSLQRDVTLAEFLDETMLDLEDVYRNRGWTWSSLRELAHLPTPAPGPHEESLRKAIGKLLNSDDPIRVNYYKSVLSQTTPPQLNSCSEHEKRLLAMLHFSLRGVIEPWPSFQESFDDLWKHPSIRSEILEMLSILDERSSTFPQEATFPLPGILMIHAQYSRDEILAAFDGLNPKSPRSLREGVWFDRNTQTDIFLITLHKTEKYFSPSTRYEDYPISNDLFHWQSQSTTSVGSTTGLRYIHHRENGTNILLFMRMKKEDDRGFAAPYLYLGPAKYVNHKGSKPISITCRLEHAMPQEIFEQAKVVAG